MRPWFVVNKPSVQANLTGLEGVIGTIGIVLQAFVKKNFKSHTMTARPLQLLCRAQHDNFLAAREIRDRHSIEGAALGKREQRLQCLMGRCRLPSFDGIASND